MLNALLNNNLAAWQLRGDLFGYYNDDDITSWDFYVYLYIRWNIFCWYHLSYLTKASTRRKTRTTWRSGWTTFCSMQVAPAKWRWRESRPSPKRRGPSMAGLGNSQEDLTPSLEVSDAGQFMAVLWTLLNGGGWGVESNTPIGLFHCVASWINT